MSSQNSKNYNNPKEIYGPEYYNKYLGPLAYDQKFAIWRNHFRSMAETLVERYHPRRVLDVGCAKGFLVEHLRNCGVEAFGIDASEYAISQASPAARPYCKVASADTPLTEKYDLITTIEVAEHMPPLVANRMVQNICNAADEIIFSSTPSDFNDDTHLNIRPASAWNEAFAAQGFFPDLHFDPVFVTPQAVHYKKLVRPIRVAVFSNEPKTYAVVRLRLLSPLQQLERLGRVQLVFVSKDDPILPVEDLLNCDLFIIQREFANRKLSQHVTACARALNKPVVFETDDLLHHLPISNPNYVHCAALARDMKQFMSEADFVTVSTSRLGEELQKDGFIKKEQTHVVTNCIDTQIWGSAPPPEKMPAKNPIVIGWMGSATHDEDLTIVKQSIAYILRKYQGRVVFKTWGYMPAELREIPGAILARGAEHNIQKHAADVRASGIDIAIAPLTDHVFNHAKSHLKWLEYAICGIPGIYSNITPYNSYVSHRYTGMIVENTNEAWTLAIEEMIENAELRRTIARNAFEVVRRQHSLDSCASRWDHLYRSFVVSGPRTEGAAIPSTREVEFNNSRESQPTRAAAALFADQTNRLISKGHLDAGVASLEQAIALEPGFASNGISFAAGLSEQCRDSVASRLLASIGDATPGDASARIALAQHYNNSGDSLHCEKLLQQIAHESNAKAADVWPLLVFYVESGRHQEAAATMPQLLSTNPAPQDCMHFTDILLKMSCFDLASQLLTSVAACNPENDELQQLKASLDDKLSGVAPAAAATPGSTPAARRVVLLTDRPATRESRTRAAGVLAELAHEARIELEFTNGVQNAGALANATLVIVPAGFLHSPGATEVLEPLVSEWKSASTPVVVEWDTTPAPAARPLLESLLSTACAVVVPHADLVHEVSAVQPFDPERIFIIPDAIDITVAARGPIRAQKGNEPLTVGYISTGRESEATRTLLRAMADRFAGTSGAAVLKIFGPVPENLQKHPAVLCAAPTCETSREWMRTLATEHCDIGAIPASPGRAARREAEWQWLQFASLQIPCVASSRAAMPSVLSHGENICLTPDTHDAWLETIAALASDHATRRAIAARALGAVLTKHTTQQIAVRWTELLNWVCESAHVHEPAANA